MSWSYSGDPADSDLDHLRFLIGDTDTTDQQFSDAEILFLISNSGSVNAAAIAGVQALIAKYSRAATSKSVGDLSITYQRIESYKALLTQLKTQQGTRAAMPFAGGISIAGKETVEGDTDRVRPAFNRDQFDHPGARSDGRDSPDPLTP